MNRIVKTTNIEVFLQCDYMTAEELQEYEDKEKRGLLKADSKNTAEEDEEDPEWADEIVEPPKFSTSLGTSSVANHTTVSGDSTDSYLKAIQNALPK